MLKNFSLSKLEEVALLSHRARDRLTAENVAFATSFAQILLLKGHGIFDSAHEIKKNVYAPSIEDKSSLRAHVIKLLHGYMPDCPVHRLENKMPPGTIQFEEWVEKQSQYRKVWRHRWLNAKISATSYFQNKTET